MTHRKHSTSCVGAFNWILSNNPSYIRGLIFATANLSMASTDESSQPQEGAAAAGNASGADAFEEGAAEDAAAGISKADLKVRITIAISCALDHDSFVHR